MRLFFYSLIAVILTSCGENKPETKILPPVYIGGTIKNSKTDVVFLKKDGLFEITTLDSTRMDSMGRFSFRNDIHDTGYYLLSIGDDYVKTYLVPGDSLGLYGDAMNFDKSLRFTGTGSEVNNYLAGKNMMRVFIESDFVSLNSLPPDTFVDSVDSLRKTLHENLTSFSTAHAMADKKFVNTEMADILYWWAIKRIEYPEYHKYFTKKNTIDIPAGYDQFNAQLSLNEAALLNIKTYSRFLQLHLNNEAEKELEKDSVLQEDENAWQLVRFRMAKNKFTDPDVRNFMLTSILQEQYMYSGINNTEEMQKEYEQLCSNELFKKKVSDLRAKWDAIAPGKPAPDFRYADIKGDTFSLSQFKGKYVYIDVWASWCGPCKREIPFLDKLEAEFKSGTIVFISVSIDESKDSWMAMVKDKKLKGVQLIADKNWKSKITRDYNIRSIPRFILVDKQGNIINSNAPRPSGKIKEVLSGLEGISS